MTAITTHVLDLTTGLPAAGLGVRLEREQGTHWQAHGQAMTDTDGRVRDGFAPLDSIGRYRLTFATGAWFAERQVASFHPEIVIVFEIRELRHHHVPLLLSPFGFSTYRGS